MNGVVCQGNPVSVPPTHSGKLKSLKVSTPTRCRSQDESKNNKAGGKTIPIVVQEELEENPSELEGLRFATKFVPYTTGDYEGQS